VSEAPLVEERFRVSLDRRPEGRRYLELPPRMASKSSLFLTHLLVAVLGVQCADAWPGRAPRVRTILGGEYWWAEEVTADYVDYLAQVKPDVIHGGVLGPELASTVHSEKHRKAITYISPSQARTMRDYLAWWHGFLKKVHRHGVKVQATISMSNVWGDHEENLGWFRYYNDLWESGLLGPRPVSESAALMERDAEGKLIRYGEGWSRYVGCVNNPHWRRVLKAMVRSGIEAGFDGFMVQFPHARGPCACEHCQKAFRSFLARRFAPETLRSELGIAGFESHQFTSTGPRPDKIEPIDLAARQFGAESVKACFDEVFIEYGRSLKPDLIVSMWTHFRQFLEADVLFSKSMGNTDVTRIVDERLLLPLDQWGRGEDYLWYSTPVYKSDLKAGVTGNATLTHRYLRAMASGTPFEVLKYDYFRWRMTVGEALANGGMAFGAWKGGWSGGKDREEPHLKTYFRFIRDNDQYLSKRDSYAEVALLYPRQALYKGDANFLGPLRMAGYELINAHILFDFVIDERLTETALRRYHALVVPSLRRLSDEQRRVLENYIRAGGILLMSQPAGAPEADTKLRFVRLGVDLEPPAGDDPGDLRDKIRGTTRGKLSVFRAPWTVQVHADHQPGNRRLLVHFVNYNRDESQAGKELPIACEAVGVDLVLPEGTRTRRVRFLTPEVRGPQRLEFQQIGNRLRFSAPRFLVYGFATVSYR